MATEQKNSKKFEGFNPTQFSILKYFEHQQRFGGNGRVTSKEIASIMKGHVQSVLAAMKEMERDKMVKFEKVSGMIIPDRQKLLEYSGLYQGTEWNAQRLENALISLAKMYRFMEKQHVNELFRIFEGVRRQWSHRSVELPKGYLESPRLKSTVLEVMSKGHCVTVLNAFIGRDWINTERVGERITGRVMSYASSTLNSAINIMLANGFLERNQEKRAEYRVTCDGDYALNLFNTYHELKQFSLPEALFLVRRKIVNGDAASIEHIHNQVVENSFLGRETMGPSIKSS
ncbi:MAG: hypothetical protein KGH61_03115 [Candidatus Micrarchaeota archaeon]|nr:hypothetical protein [Candidatus Micrarchaeota archaeon]MDE1847913.1 hypothetical protein [Candidatus Micrarchaeota archaeon]MDE1864963.1 hypothetical protein [Candidatus Micrarchaeota archaeon]